MKFITKLVLHKFVYGSNPRQLVTYGIAVACKYYVKIIVSNVPPSI